jgi:hypothetical protein
LRDSLAFKISNLQPTGAELFSDSESYMSELDEKEIVATNGGIFLSVPNTTTHISTLLLSRYPTNII